MKFGNIDTDSISFGGAKGDCYCSLEERFTVTIESGQVPGSTIWSFFYISLAVCDEDDSESWNEKSPDIDVTDDDVYIGWFRRKGCGNCTQEECGNTKVICRDHVKGSGAIDNIDFQNMTESILRLEFYARNNPSRVSGGLLKFVEDYMMCKPGPDCETVSKICSRVTPPPN